MAIESMGDTACLLLSQLVSWFHPIDWSATGTMIGGLSTLAVAILTVLLIRENKLLRKAGSAPRVVAHFEFHPDGNGGLNLALSNVGTGAALDVSFSFEYDDEDFNNYNIIVDYAQKRPAITMIAQGDKVSFLFAVGFQLFKPKDKNVSKQLKPFQVNVSWRAPGSSKLFSERYPLDVAAYAGLPGMMNKPPLLKIADELCALNKNLASCACMPLLDATMPEQSTRSIAKGTSEGGE